MIDIIINTYRFMPLVPWPYVRMRDRRKIWCGVYNFPKRKREGWERISLARVWKDSQTSLLSH